MSKDEMSGLILGGVPVRESDGGVHILTVLGHYLDVEQKAKEAKKKWEKLEDGRDKTSKDNDKPAKPPLGTWKRDDGKTAVTITVGEKMTHVVIKSEKLNLDYEADSSVSGKNALYACIRKVKEGDDKVTGELFGFEYEVKQDELVLSKFKGTGAIALGGFFMNGTYKKEGAKK